MFGRCSQVPRRQLLCIGQPTKTTDSAACVAAGGTSYRGATPEKLLNWKMEDSEIEFARNVRFRDVGNRKVVVKFDVGDEVTICFFGGSGCHRRKVAVTF